MKLLSSLLGALTFGVDAVEYESECVNGIRVALGYFRFASDGHENPFQMECGNPLSVYSIWAAAKSWCTPSEIAIGERFLMQKCQQIGIDVPSYASVLPNLTDSYLQSLPVVNFEDRGNGRIWDTPFLISESFCDDAKRTMWYFELEYYLHRVFGNLNYIFWGTVLLIGVLFRFTRYLKNRQDQGSYQKLTDDTEESARELTATNFPFKFYHLIRTYLVIPPAFGTRHKQLLFWCEVPTRLETVVLLAYYALNIVLCTAAYFIFPTNLFYTPKFQALRYVADRTGIVSYANLPVLWLFSGRNNVFLWATGWQFSTFHLFHRHIARVATLQGFIHTVCYAWMEHDFGRLWRELQQRYWIMGLIGMATMVLLLVFSSVFLRHKAYEVFLVLHFILAAATIWALFNHTIVFHGHYDGYLYPLVIVWVLDRTARLVRQAYCNLHISWSGSVHSTTATATYDKTSDLIRLTMTPGSRLLKPDAHQYYFIYQPLRWKFWENHPFTLASWEEKGTPASSPVPTPQISAVSETEPLLRLSPALKPNADVKTKSLQSDDQYELLFYIRPFGGYTAWLRDECLKSPDGVVHPRMLIEGPYGPSAPLHAFENVLLVAGGTGIAAMTAYFKKHIDDLAAGRTSTRHVTLLWTAKQAAMIEDIAVRELALPRGCEGVEMEFYATRQHDPREIPPTSSPLNSNLPAVAITHGRPKISQAVQQAVADANGSKVAVFVCGPAAMADEARNAVQKMMKRGTMNVEYFEESFGW